MWGVLRDLKEVAEIDRAFAELYRDLQDFTETYRILQKSSKYKIQLDSIDMSCRCAGTLAEPWQFYFNQDFRKSIEFSLVLVEFWWFSISGKFSAEDISRRNVDFAEDSERPACLLSNAPSPSFWLFLVQFLGGPRNSRNKKHTKSLI